jgi:carbon-monoxide dehydrogenase large subunit
VSAAPIVQMPKYVGARILRVEDPRFMRGLGSYVDDISLPGMLHAAFLRSPHAHARIHEIRTEQARELDGVVAVFTGRDLEELIDPYVTVLERDEVADFSRRVLPIDRARHVGEAVAVAVATSRYLAEDACELIEVDWGLLPALTDAEEALAADAVFLHDELGTNNAAHIEFENGDVEKAFAGAAHVFSKRFHGGRHMAAPLETRGVLAAYDLASGEATVWSSTQMPHYLRTEVARAAGFLEGKLRFIAPDVGGGFGMKCHVFVEEAIVPVLAKLLGRPVKWIEDRYENLAASAHAKEMIVYLEIAVDEDGRFLAFRTRCIGDAGAYSIHPWTALIDPLCAATLMPGLYRWSACRFEADAVLTNKCQTGAYRGVGFTPGHAAREVLIDEIARALGEDPVELRVKNTIPSEPYESITGMPYDGGSYVEAIRKAQELVGYDELRDGQRRLREKGRYIGVGFSPFVEPTAWGSAQARAEGFPAEFFDSASVTVEPDGSVTVTTGLHNHGQGHETSLAQLAADRLGVPFETIKIVQGDTSTAVYGMGTYASRSAVIGGGCIIRATGDVNEKLRRLAGHVMEVHADDLEIHEGVISVKGSPERAMTVSETAWLAYFGGERRPPDMEPALTATRSYDPPATFSNGAAVAVVEVDVETGFVDLQRIVAVEDCGVVLNPMIVEGQVCGAMAQGIGGCLYENLVYDESGQFLSSTLMDYLYPSTMDVPPIDIAHLETPSPVTEGGIKGMAEAGTIAVAGAICNAIADALNPFGIRIDRTPLGPNEVLGLIREARGVQYREE